MSPFTCHRISLGPCPHSWAQLFSRSWPMQRSTFFWWNFPFHEAYMEKVDITYSSSVSRVDGNIWTSICQNYPCVAPSTRGHFDRISTSLRNCLLWMFVYLVFTKGLGDDDGNQGKGSSQLLRRNICQPESWLIQYARYATSYAHRMSLLVAVKYSLR